ncbi:retinal pigment epithelial membrane protein [Pycnococcus provasolii]
MPSSLSSSSKSSLKQRSSQAASSRRASRRAPCRSLAVASPPQRGTNTNTNTTRPPNKTPPTPSSKAPFQEQYASYKSGYKSVPSKGYENACFVAPKEGSVPTDMRGTLLRNGPAMFERNGMEKSYLDGDGMVVSIAFENGKAFFRNKFVQTEHFIEEEKQDKFIFPSIFTEWDPRDNATWCRLVDDCLMGNLERKHNGAYNVIDWGGSLVAVDYKKPYALSRTDLSTLGHGNCDLSSAMHTSHYRIIDEGDGSGRRLVAFLNEVNWRTRTTTAVFYVFDEQGNELRRDKYDFNAAYVHDFILTENYYVLFDCPIKIDLPTVFGQYIFETACLSQSIAEDTTRKPLFRLMPRYPERMPEGQRDVVTIESNDKFCYAYHHVNGFDTEDGRLVFDTCSWDRFTLYFQDIVAPDGVNTFPRMRLSRFVIDPVAGTSEHVELDDTPCELPIVNWDWNGKPYRHMYLSTSVGREPGAAPDGTDVHGPMQALTKVSMKEEGCGEVDMCMLSSVESKKEWVPGTNKFAMEPFFVAREGGDPTDEDDGYIVCLVHDAGETPAPGAERDVSTECAILDAKSMECVCRLELPVFVPFGVHGTFTRDYCLGPEPQHMSAGN